MTPEQRADILNDQHGPEFNALERSAAGVMGHPALERYDLLVKITDRLAEMVSSQTPCRRGCSLCCYQAVPMPRQEALRLAAASGRELHEAAGRPMNGPTLLALHNNAQRYTGAVCPFLDGTDCSIYAARPIACRAHHVIEDDASKCDTANPGQRIAKFDITFCEGALAEASMQDTWADIREWFQKPG